MRTGDKVLATDPKTGRTTVKTVTAEITGKGLKHLVRITLSFEAEGRKQTASVIATDGHPFWVPELGAWVDATDLIAGEQLDASSGAVVTITAIHRRIQPATVYNLTVADIHTYYVLAGDTPVLVHNSTPTPSTPQGVVYLRTDLITGEEYVGQAKSWSRYLKRQSEHARDYPGKSFTLKCWAGRTRGRILTSWRKAGCVPAGERSPCPEVCSRTVECR
ncbi:polymorphic toxin-type HINT domain-containing protein [Streptomyces sp. 900105755]